MTLAVIMLQGAQTPLWLRALTVCFETLRKRSAVGVSHKIACDTYTCCEKDVGMMQMLDMLCPNDAHREELTLQLYLLVSQFPEAFRLGKTSQDGPDGDYILNVARSSDKLMNNIEKIRDSKHTHFVTYKAYLPQSVYIQSQIGHKRSNDNIQILF